MIRLQRIEILHEWWNRKTEGDLERARKSRLTETRANTEDEEDWYRAFEAASRTLLELEAKKRWAVSDSTARDYAKTVLAGADRNIRLLAKLTAREMSSRS